MTTPTNAAQREPSREAMQIAGIYLPPWNKEARNYLASTIDAHTEAIRTRLAEALKYGAPVAGAKLPPHIKTSCGKHDAYWTTISGACMACRAEDAEKRLALAVEARAADALRAAGVPV